jgi:hypothetical protein
MIRRDAVMWEPATECVIPAPGGMTMMVQSLVSMVMLAFVAARTVNILP